MADYSLQLTGTEIDARLAKVPQLETGLAGKQATLVSGTNIKTINNESILGSGNIVVGSSESYVKAWDGQSTPTVSDIPAGVVVTYDGTNYTGTLPASSSTLGKIYLVYNGTDYDRYITSQNGSSYSWVSLGSTQINLDVVELLERNLRLIYDSLGAAAFWDGKPDIDWSGNSVPVSLSLSNCTSSNIASYVAYGDPYYTEITPASGSILARVSCTMGGEDVLVVNGVIDIAEVTGAIIITAVGANLDTIAYDGKTYRQIFETNNKLVGKGLSPGFDNGSYSPATVSSGSPAITSNEYDTPSYSIDCTSAGASSQLKIASITGIASVNLFIAARVKITSWTHGLVGIVHYSNTSATLARVTNGWETVSAILNEQGTNCFFGAFNQSGTGATLTGFLDSPVMILMSSFSTAPTIDKLNALYEEYINIKKAS